jgi:hypothetical protein
MRKFIEFSVFCLVVIFFLILMVNIINAVLLAVGVTT